MADYSWCTLIVASTDEAVVDKVAELAFGGSPEQILDHAEGITLLEGETSYGLAEDAEQWMIDNGVPYDRFSDGKYDYDGDQAHWRPGMEAPRTFSRMNNGGACITESEVRGKTDAEILTIVRETFSFEMLASDAAA